MKNRKILGAMLTLLSISVFMSAFNIQSVKAEGAISIMSDGSIVPSTAPISTTDNTTYRLTDDIVTSGISIDRKNIVLDGDGHTVQGPGSSGNGIYVNYHAQNVTIKSTKITGFFLGIEVCSNCCTVSGNNAYGNLDSGILLYKSCYSTVSRNNVSGNSYGIFLWWGSDFNVVWGNNVFGNDEGIDLYQDCNHNTVSDNNVSENACGIWIDDRCIFNIIYHNNIINSGAYAGSSDCLTAWDNGYSSGGNYWSDYDGNDTYSGIYQNETGSDGIGDTPYVIDANNRDNYPYMNATIRLTITSTEGGTTDPSVGSYVCQPESVVNVTAIPSANWVFDRWELDGVTAGTASSINVTMDTDHSLCAVFKTCILTITSTEGGTTDPSVGSYVCQPESVVNVTAIPSANWVFDRWELDGVPAGTASSINVTMDTDHSLHANFTTFMHDVAITDVETSSNFAYQGDDVTLHVSAFDRCVPETFNVSAYADMDTTFIGDEITIGTQELSLPSWGSADMVFDWNTTGVPAGNYTISAFASCISDADPSDNLRVDGKVEIFAVVPCPDINITCPTALTVNPSIFTYDDTLRARLVNIGNVTVTSTGFEGNLRVVGSRVGVSADSESGTIRLCVDQPDVDVHYFHLSLDGEVQVPLWLMFQPETHWETYDGNFTLQLTVCGTHRIPLEIIGISIRVCENGAYIVNNETVTFSWNLTGGSWVYLEAETSLPPGWSYSVDPPVSTLFETPHTLTVNITAPPDAKEGDMGSVTLRAYKNATGTMIWQFVYFASTNNEPPTIEDVQPPTLTQTGGLLFNTTVKDASGIENVQLNYSVNNGDWDSELMSWSSGDTFNSTSYTLTAPHMPDNSVIQYYVVATNWLGNQTQSTVQTATVKYDMAATEERLGKTIVSQGLTTQVNVTAENQGTIPNTSLKVFLHANATLIKMQSIPFLSNGTAANLTFLWNTTGLAYGNYTISAYVEPVPDETNTSNNFLTGRWVIVALPGDLTGSNGWPDGKVDMKDIGVVARLFGVNYPSPRYNPNCDINDDGRIDMKDIGFVARHFGQHYP